MLDAPILSKQFQGVFNVDAVVMFQGTIFEKGYGQLARLVMRDKSLKIQSKAIYSYIVSFASNSNSAERTAFPSVELQCEELGISENTYFTHRKALIQKGYLKIEKRKSDEGKFDKNLYIVAAVPVPLPSEPKALLAAVPQNLGYGENLDKSTIEPHLKNCGVEKPYLNSSGMENSRMENCGAKTKRFKTKRFKKEKDSLASLGSNEINSVDLILKQVFKDCPYEEIKAKLFEDAEKGEVEISSPNQYRGLMRYRLNDYIRSKSPQTGRIRTKRLSRTELLPKWFHELETAASEPENEVDDSIEEKRKEIMRKIEKFRK